jgi:hypothetical protein
MTNQDQLTLLKDNLYELSLPSGSRVPGPSPTVAMERAFAVRILMDLENNAEAFVTGVCEIMNGVGDESHAMCLGRAFVSSMQVNTGNRYGVIGMINCLRAFNNAEVSPFIGEMLGLIETHVRAAGGTIKEQDESPSSH